MGFKGIRKMWQLLSHMDTGLSLAQWISSVMGAFLASMWAAIDLENAVPSFLFIVFLVALALLLFVIRLLAWAAQLTNRKTSIPVPDIGLHEAIDSVKKHLEEQHPTSNIDTYQKAEKLLDASAHNGQLQVWGVLHEYTGNEWKPTIDRERLIDSTYWLTHSFGTWSDAIKRSGYIDISKGAPAPRYFDVRFNSAQVIKLWPRKATSMHKVSQPIEPVFLAHSEGIGRHTPSVSWLHLKVDTTESDDNIANAKISMEIEISGKTHKRKMRWQSDLDEGGSTTTLTHAEIKKVPVARRNDGAGITQITDDDYLVTARHNPTLDQPAPNLFALTEGSYEVHFTVKAGKKEWRSGLYKLHVPASGEGNSHFHLEKIEY